MADGLEYSREQALQALSDAALEISGELALESTLQHIVESAATLVSTRYAALAVFSSDGILKSFTHTGISPQEEARISHPPQGRGLLKAVLDERRELRVSNIGQDSRSVGFPSGHPEMTTFLGVPILAGDEILGNLYLTDRENAAEFTGSDAELIRIFASLAAVAIKNAQLHERLSQATIGEERSRIGMDLHDGVIQSIYAVGLKLERAAILLDEEHQEAKSLLDQAVIGLNDAIIDIRNFILDLRPRRFEGNLNDGLSRLVREFQANMMIEVEVDAPPQLSDTLPPVIANAFLLTTQEALANVARHAKATHVEVELNQNGNQATLSVSDDGIGFDLGQQAPTVGHGLANLRSRASDLQGFFDVVSSPGSGTTISLTLPIT